MRCSAALAGFQKDVPVQVLQDQADAVSYLLLIYEGICSIAMLQAHREVLAAGLRTCCSLSSSLTESMQC